MLYSLPEVLENHGWEIIISSNDTLATRSFKSDDSSSFSVIVTPGYIYIGKRASPESQGLPANEDFSAFKPDDGALKDILSMDDLLEVYFAYVLLRDHKYKSIKEGAV